MPTINIPPKVRFALYLLGVVGAVVVQYAIDRAWFGEAEMRLWSGLAGVLFMLAAAKTTLAPNADSQSLAALQRDQVEATAHLHEQRAHNREIRDRLKMIGDRLDAAPREVGQAITRAVSDGSTGRGKRG